MTNWSHVKGTGVTPISPTVGTEQVVDELIVSFTHDRRIDFMLPGVEPTGRRSCVS